MSAWTDAEIVVAIVGVWLILNSAIAGWWSWRSGNRFKAIAEEAAAYNDAPAETELLVYAPRCSKPGRRHVALQYDDGWECMYCGLPATLTWADPTPTRAAPQSQETKE